MKTVKESFKSPSLSCFLWRLVLESFKSLVLAAFFWDFLWLFFYFLWLFYTIWVSFILQKPAHYDGHKCNHLWWFCDSLKAVTKKAVIESFKSPSLASFFVTIYDLVYFYTSLAQGRTGNIKRWDFFRGPFKFGGLQGNRGPPDDLFFFWSAFFWGAPWINIHKRSSKEVTKSLLKKSQKAF
jgi:hypothetical protein